MQFYNIILFTRYTHLLIDLYGKNFRYTFYVKKCRSNLYDTNKAAQAYVHAQLACILLHFHKHGPFFHPTTRARGKKFHFCQRLD